MTQTTIGAGGEEWLTMDETTGYSAAAEADTILAARERIPQVRQREVQLRLVDRRGQPIAHAPVAIEQTDSAFLWGHGIWDLDTRVREGTQDHDDCRAEHRHMNALLNAASAMHYWTERPQFNAPRSEQFLGHPRYEHLQWCVDWANAEGLTVKGHPLLWTVPKAIPDWLQAYDSYDTRMAFLEVRIRQIVNRFRGKIRIYDAINEPMWEPAFKDLPERNWPNITAISDIADYVEPVLRWAREEDPDAIYLINEYGVSFGDHTPCAMKGSDGSTVTPDSQFHRYLDLMAELQQRGAPPDAVGLQGHTGGWGHHDRQLATYEKIMEVTGLPVHITEFWAKTGHLQKAGMPQDEIQARQLEYVTNCMTCAFGCEAVDAFFFWGITQDLLIHNGKGVVTTPVYDGLYELLHKTWRTRKSCTTDADGCLRFRGYHGDYSLRLQPKGAAKHTHGHRFVVPVGKDLLSETLRVVHQS